MRFMLSSGVRCVGLVAVLCGSVVGVSGCQTGAAAIGLATNSEDAQGREGFVWSQPMNDIDAPAPGRTSVYVQFRDMSGQSINLRDDLRSTMEDLGYTITMNPDTADYKLEVCIRSFDRNRFGDSNDATSATMSTTGDAVVTNAGRQVAGTGSILDPITGAIGDLFGQRVGNDTTAREWVMVADVKLAQRIEGGVDTSVRSGRSSIASTSSGRGNSGGYSGGTQVATSGQSQEFLWTKNHIEYTGQLTAFTAKWGQTQVENAKQALTPRLLRGLAEALPPAV